MALEDWALLALQDALRQLGKEEPLGVALSECCAPGNIRRAVHLAVLVEPFLGFVLDGTKSVESRFSSAKFPPFLSVEEGDLVFLKAVSGPVIGACLVNSVFYFSHPSGAEMTKLRERFGAALRDDVPGFWDDRIRSSYVSLFGLAHVRALGSPIECPKKDRRGWVVLRQPRGQLMLLE